MGHVGSSLSTMAIATLLASGSMHAQGLRVGLLGGTTDLTAGGWSVAGLTFSETGPYAVGAQVGNKGAGAMVELQWRNDRTPMRVADYEYVSLGAGYRFGGHGTGFGWGQWNLLAGSRVLPAPSRGMLFDVGFGVYGTIGGGGSNLYSPHTGLAGRILVGWVF